MSAAIRGKTAIVGIGSAGVGEAPGYSAIELLGQASLKAIADAGLKLSDIDAVFAATSSMPFPPCRSPNTSASARNSWMAPILAAPVSSCTCCRPLWHWRPVSATLR